MSEFTPITTQEAFDAAISDRIKRERETMARKYGDYDDLKSRAAEYEKQIGDLTKAAEDNAKKYAGFDKTLAELNAKVKSYESGSVKTRIAHELGLPYELAGRLSGETEDDIRKDAAALSKALAATKPGPTVPPLRSTEPAGGDSKRAALRTLTNQLTNQTTD